MSLYSVTVVKPLKHLESHWLMCKEGITRECSSSAPWQTSPAITNVAGESVCVSFGGRDR